MSPNALRLSMRELNPLFLQLLRRSRMMQPLPYHRILGQDRQALLSTLLQHMDPRSSGEVPAAWAELALSLINPR